MVVGVCRVYAGAVAWYSCGGRVARAVACVSDNWCGLHRVPGDNAASEVDVRALDAVVHDVHAHALARQLAVVVFAVDRAALGINPGRAHPHAQPLRATTSTWFSVSWSPGEESSLSSSDMSARWRQSTSIEETAGSLAMRAMV